MMTATTFIRVRYGETDQMGYVYYGNYATYFEVARVEFLRSIGLNYKELEEGGVMLPVRKLECQYYHPAKYDDLLKIVTTIPTIPTGPRIEFSYRIYNEDEVLITEGYTQLVFVDIEKNRPCRAPEILKNKLIELDKLESL